MPVYAYKCASCGWQFDLYQHYTDDSLQVCPHCKQPALQKQYDPPPVHFHGHGWYSKDSASKTWSMNESVRSE